MSSSKSDIIVWSYTNIRRSLRQIRPQFYFHLYVVFISREQKSFFSPKRLDINFRYIYDHYFLSLDYCNKYYLVFLHYKFFLTPPINFLCFVVIGKLSTCKTADWTSFFCREGSKVLKKSSSRSGFIFFQILWKSRCNILVTFPSHLKKITFYTEILTRKVELWIF